MIRLNHLESHEYVQHVIYFFLRLSNMQIWVGINKLASLHHDSTPLVGTVDSNVCLINLYQ